MKRQFLTNTIYTRKSLLGSECFGKNNLYSHAESCSRSPHEKVFLKDIAQIIAPEELPKIKNL